jgi:adenosylmethionine-8-amino-7-oxononanoate aminotransferase
MSVSADSPFTSAFESLRLPVSRVGNPEELRQLLAQSDEEIACLIVEPLIQGAGGMLLHSVDFLKQLRELCTQHGVLFIADEVFTGFGRTGKMFACDVAGIAPDLMCLSKGLTGGFLPLAVTLCTEKIYEAFYSVDRSRTFFHGHSYSGNPLGCAAANASLRIFETEPVFERISAIESIHRERMPELARKTGVVDSRILGTIAALELRADDAGYLSRLRPQLYAFFIESGILLRPLGNVVYVVPPYIMTADELHRIYDVIGKCKLF